jgi:hypothetical protein
MLLGVFVLLGQPASMVVDPVYGFGVVVLLNHLVEFPDMAVWMLVGEVFDCTRGLVDLQEPMRLQECIGNEGTVGVDPKFTV